MFSGPLDKQQHINPASTTNLLCSCLVRHCTHFMPTVCALSIGKNKYWQISFAPYLEIRIGSKRHGKTYEANESTAWLFKPSSACAGIPYSSPWSARPFPHRPFKVCGHFLCGGWDVRASRPRGVGMCGHHALGCKLCTSMYLLCLHLT